MNYDLTLYYFLKRNLRICYKTTSGNEMHIRCPYCGDSKKDKNLARFYIQNKYPFKFICFNCGISGVINENVLNNVLYTNESNFEIIDYIKNQRKQNIYNSNFKYNNSTSKLKNNVIFNIEDIKYLKKLEYINNRLETNITENDLDKFKIVLNIEEFFVHNNLNIKQRFYNEKLLEQFKAIKDNYIGFLSNDKSTIIFRNTDPNCDKRQRFANISIDPYNENNSKMYSIKKDIDLYKDKYNLVITESILDIINLYLNFYNDKNLDDYIFLSNCGKSYLNTVQYISSLSLLNNNITIYSDKDVDINFYKQLKNNNPEFQYNNVSVYYNTLEKDFGVPKSKIEISRKIKI